MKPLSANQESGGQAIDPLYDICSNCSVRELCLPVGFTLSEFTDIDKAVNKRYTFKRKEHIFQINQPFQGLYAIQSGTVKCYRTNYQGNEEVIGFYLPGELIGLEAIHSGQHESSAVCLATAKVCEIQLDQLLVIAAKIPNLQRQLLNIMSQRLAVQEEHAQQRTAEQRVAALILNLSYRYRLRGFSAIEFALPMSRQEIGNYLNLATETVSRIISQFQQLGILTVQSKHLKLLAIAELERMVL